MKSQEVIEEKIKKMKEDMQQYVDIWNSSITMVNGIPIPIEGDLNYNIIKNQIEALEWVLKDK